MNVIFHVIRVCSCVSTKYPRLQLDLLFQACNAKSTSLHIHTPLLSYHHVTPPALWRAREMRATAKPNKTRWKPALHNTLFPPSPPANHRRIPKFNPLT